MLDQASTLRHLLLREHAAGGEAPHSRLIVVAGGKPSLGVTTLSVNLAVALARSGSRTVLIDADLQQADAAILCGCSPTPNLGEVLASRRDIHEVLQRGPGGMQLIAGMNVADARTQTTTKGQKRFLRQLHSLGKHVDVFVVDAGSAPTDFARQLWAAADDVLLVTSPDVVAVMDSYAAIKTMFTPALKHPQLRLIVNQAEDQAQARDVFRRIDQSCQRFLEVSLTLAAALPVDSQAVQAARHGVPVLLLTPQAPLCRAIDQLTDDLLKEPEAPTSGVRGAA
jgi:flagellar biosynthesis protein FlhG